MLNPTLNPTATELRNPPSPTLFEAFFENHPDPCFILEQGVLINGNRAALQILGFSQLSELQGLKPSDLSPTYQPDGTLSRTKGEHYVAHCLVHGTLRFEWIHQRPRDGVLLPMEVTLLHLQTNGQSLVLAIWRDISDRQRDLNALREREHLLRTVIDELPDILVLKDHRGNFLLCNQTVAQLYGTTPEAMVGKDDGDFGVPQEMAEFFRANVLAIMERGETEIVYEDSQDAATGEVRHFKSIKKPFKDAQGRNQILVIAQDITDIKRSQARVAESEQRLSEVMSATREGIWDWDIQSGIVKHNELWYRMLGYTEGDLPDSVETFAKLIHSDDLTLVWQRLTDLLEGKLPLYYSEHRMVTSNRGTIWVQDRGRVVQRDESGKALRVVGSFTDISERKRLELELRRHRDELEERVARRTEQLEIARHEAEQLAQAKSNFLANMSHEIRTPLNAILGLAQVGQRQYTDPHSRRLFDQMLDSGRLLLGIINDILDFSKIEAGKLVIEAEPIVLTRLLEHLLTLTKNPAQSKGLSLRLTTEADLPEAFLGDSLRLSQVLGNLLSNAVKFTDRGEVVLSVHHDTTTDRLQFRVLDSGIGMSREQIARLFTPFEQADSSTTRRFGGTGLGLAISKRLVELMQGTLTVESELGHWSQFEVSLPFCRVADHHHFEQNPTQPLPATHRLSGYRILAAEDNQVNQMVLADLLQLEGAELLCVNDGEEALRCLHDKGEAQWSLVLTDIQMPRMDGHQLTRQICQLYPQLPVIGLTAHALAEERQRCLESGMVAHIAKPIDLEALITAIVQHGRRIAQSTPQLPLPDQPTAPFTPTGALINWELLLHRLKGRHAFVAKIVAVTLQHHRHDAEQIRQAAARADLTALHQIAHTLKGVCGHLQAIEVMQLADQTEQAARIAAPETIPLSYTLAEAIDALMMALTEQQCRDEISPTQS